MANTTRITLSDGTTISIPADTVTDQLASIPLVGAGVFDYGEPIAEGQLRSLENFYHSEPPENPITGQLWYNSDSDQLLVYHSNNTWTQVGAAPEVFLDDFDDVSVTAVADGDVLGYDGTLWRNTKPVLRFVDLTDTPGAYQRGRFFKVNAAGSALRYVDSFSAPTDFSGVALLTQLPLVELCAYFRDNACFPDPPPPPATVSGTHTAGTACVTEQNTSCTVFGTLTASITNAASLTAPFTYTWSRVSGETLDAGASISQSGVFSSSHSVPVSLTRTATLVGDNDFSSSYRVTVTDSNTPPRSVQADAANTATYTVTGQTATQVDPPTVPDSITSTAHQGGTVAVPVSQTATITGSASAVFTPGGTNSTQPYTYTWSVTDGKGALFVPAAGGAPVTSTTTSTAQVATAVTGAANTTIRRRGSVTVRGRVAGVNNEFIATADLPSADYEFTLQPAVPQTHTLFVEINGVRQSQADGFQILRSNRSVYPAQGSQITEGSTVNLLIERTDPAWQLTGVQGCNPIDRTDTPPDLTSVSFEMPTNSCTLQVSTEQPQPEYTLTTVVPTGFSVSHRFGTGTGAFQPGGFPSGVQLAAGTVVKLQISRTDPARQLDSIQGCGGFILQPQPDPNVWVYQVQMPAEDCVVEVQDSAVPFDPEWDGNSYDDDIAPFAQEQSDDSNDVLLEVLSSGVWRAVSVRTGVLDSGTWYVPGVADLQARFQITINTITDGIVAAPVPGEIVYAGWRVGTGNVQRAPVFDTNWFALGQRAKIAAVGGWSVGSEKEYGCNITVTVQLRRSSRPTEISTSTVNLESLVLSGGNMIAPLPVGSGGGGGPPGGPPGGGGGPVSPVN